MKTLLIEWLFGFIIVAAFFFAIAGLVYLIGTGQWVLALLLAAALVSGVGVLTS